MNNEKHIKNLFAYDQWKLIQNKLDNNNDDFLIAESLMSLGNGYFGSRGNFEEHYSGKSHIGVYNGGIWFPDKTKVGWWKNGYPLYFGKVINSLNFLPIKVFVNGIELDLNIYKPTKFKRVLEMDKAILSRQFTVKINDIELNCKTERFYSIDDHETAYINYQIIPNKDCEIEYVCQLDGDVRNLDSNHDEQFWLPVFCEVVDKMQLNSIITKANNFGIEQFQVANGCICDCDYDELDSNTTQWLSQQIFQKKVKANTVYEISKKIVVITSRHYEKNEIKKQLIKKINVLKKINYYDAKKKHIAAWTKRWLMCDIKIEGDIISQQGIRFCLFQLFSTYYGEDKNFNIGPKGFTGEKYGGATYWDTEAFCLPTYLAVSPQYVALNLLEYRYNQLNAAIANAKSLGLDGALYPMVTFNGVECHNEWEITFEEIHRNGAIAYAIYNYTNYTGDDTYLKSKGIDVLINISKFWASRVHFNKSKKCYMIHGVTGPNEFENNVNNNWYTNLIAQWTLNYTIDTLQKYNLITKKFKKWNLTNKDLLKWKNIIKKIYLPYNKNLNIFVQHDGFLDKEFINVKNLKATDRPIVHNWSWDKILRSCFIKQADVLQGIYLFEDNFKLDQIKANYEFYTKYTVHESSLSPCIHAIIASKLNKLNDAFNFFQRSARLDLDNYNNDTKDGLHITSMAGAWMAIVQGFAEVRVKKNNLVLNPKIPKQWKSYEFNLSFRKRIININVSKKEVKINLIKGQALTIILNNKKISLTK